MTWDFIFLFQQQKHFSGYQWLNMPNISFLMGNHCTIANMSFFFIRRFLRAAQASRKVRLASDLTSSFKLCICFNIELSSEVYFADSFYQFGISGQLSCGVDFGWLWILEISSFSCSSIGCFPCQMDAWPIWPPMGTYERQFVHTAESCLKKTYL